MKITPTLLDAATSCGVSTSLSVAPALDAAMEHFDIQSPDRVAAFLAQLAQESGGFRNTREGLYYMRAPALKAIWPSRFPSEAFANQYLRSPEKLANYVYCNRLGNGNIQSGDGWRFRGGGYSQITGRTAWANCSTAIGADLLAEPQLIDRPTYAALSAAWFWSVNGLLLLADRANLEGYKTLTKRLNGGLVGFEDGNTTGNDDRVERWDTARRALGIA